MLPTKRFGEDGKSSSTRASSSPMILKLGQSSRGSVCTSIEEKDPSRASRAFTDESDEDPFRVSLMGGKIVEDPDEINGGRARDWSVWAFSPKDGEDPFWFESIGTKEWWPRVSEGKESEDPSRFSSLKGVSWRSNEDTSKIPSKTVGSEGAGLISRVSMVWKIQTISVFVFVFLSKECENENWVLRVLGNNFGSKFLGFENWRVL